MKIAAKTLTMMISGLMASITRAEASLPAQGTETIDKASKPVSLRPLNLPGDNLFAGHRSHSSHRSHRSSSGGGYYQPAPQRQQSMPTDPGRPAPVTPTPATPRGSPLSTAEKRKLQIMQTQIALTTAGYYRGPISGNLDAATKESLKGYQKSKSLQVNGLMTTETLNALGVAVIK
jgi:His-Xaa-Ser repeat protein HxsA